MNLAIVLVGGGVSGDLDDVDALDDGGATRGGGAVLYVDNMLKANNSQKGETRRSDERRRPFLFNFPHAIYELLSVVQHPVFVLASRWLGR